MCLRAGRGAKECEVSAACDSDGVAEADGSLMSPEVLRDRRQVKGYGRNTLRKGPFVNTLRKGVIVDCTAV